MPYIKDIMISISDFNNMLSCVTNILQYIANRAIKEEK